MKQTNGPRRDGSDYINCRDRGVGVTIFDMIEIDISQLNCSRTMDTILDSEWSQTIMLQFVLAIRHNASTIRRQVSHFIEFRIRLLLLGHFIVFQTIIGKNGNIYANHCYFIVCKFVRKMHKNLKFKPVLAHCSPL